MIPMAASSDLVAFNLNVNVANNDGDSLDPTNRANRSGCMKGYGDMISDCTMLIKCRY